MSGQQIVFLVILVGTLSLFVTERLRIDMTALLALLALTITGILRVPTYDGHDSEPMADTIPTAWRTVFRWHGGHVGGRIGTLSAMIS